MPETRVVELETEDEWLAAYDVLTELRPQDERTYLRRLHTMCDEEGYHLFGLFEAEELVALAGVRELMTLYHGNHVWVYDLVTTESRRSEGFGVEMLSWVEEWATDRDANVVELASGLWRDEAHRFYEEKAGYERYCLTFKKDL